MGEKLGMKPTQMFGFTNKCSLKEAMAPHYRKQLDKLMNAVEVKPKTKMPGTVSVRWRKSRQSQTEMMAKLPGTIEYLPVSADLSLCMAGQDGTMLALHPQTQMHSIIVLCNGSSTHFATATTTTTTSDCCGANEESASIARGWGC